MRSNLTIADTGADQSFHTATLELLETVGGDVHHDEARQMLADATLTEIRREAETKLKDHYFTS